MMITPLRHVPAGARRRLLPYVAILLAACGGGGDGTPTGTGGGGGGGGGNNGVAVVINPNTAAIKVGQSVTITATVTGSSNANVTWTTSNGNASLITAGGPQATMIGQTSGTTVVTATSQADPSKSATATITVSGEVTAITLAPATVNVTVGSTGQFGATVTTTGGLPTTATYSSSNNNIATITSTGQVRGVNAGTATITATSTADPSKTATATVVVRPTVAFCGLAGISASISLGQTINGTLTANDCALGDGSYADIYRFNLVTNQSVTIEMTSTAFDAYLLLLDANGNPIEQNDDAFNVSDARIFRFLGGGTYYIVANSFDPNRTGSYSLTVK